jgi:hypothetical protein
VRELEQAMAEPVCADALIDPHQTLLDQRLQDAVQVPLGRAGRLDQILEAERPVGVPHRIGYRQPLAQRLCARDRTRARRGHPVHLW